MASSFVAPRVASGGSRYGLMPRRSALRADSAAVSGPQPARRNSLRACKQALRSNSRRESVHDKKSPIFSGCEPNTAAAPEIAHTGRRLPRQGSARGVRAVARPHRSCKGAAGRAVAHRSRGACAVRCRGRARSALRHLTRRGCLNGIKISNFYAVSSAAARDIEQRRGVGAQRRPPRGCATARPVAPLPRGLRERTRMTHTNRSNKEVPA